MQQETCSSCRFFFPQGPNGQPGICRRHPPTAGLVLVPQGSVQVQLVPTPFNIRPSLPPGEWCGDWEDGGPKLEVVQ